MDHLVSGARQPTIVLRVPCVWGGGFVVVFSRDQVQFAHIIIFRPEIFFYE